jgi:suppressor of ftsI
LAAESPLIRILKRLGALVGIAVAVLLAVIWFIPAERAQIVNAGQRFEKRLAIPPLLLPRAVGGEKVFDLAIQQGETELLAGRRTHTFGFSGTYLGPTLRARKGDKVRVNVTNSLAEPTTTHWHGMHLPAVMDGGPHQVIGPAEMWRPHWTVTNDAATLWYHPHMMGATAHHVYRGLAGLFLIDDDRADALGLPSEYGVNDIPLIVQDRKFDAAGQFVYEEPPAEAAGWLDNPTGMMGDRILVNGTLGPFVEVPSSTIRLRFLNGSNARRFNFGFLDNRAFHQIATDGGLLERPVERTRLILAPGERAEILVDVSQVQAPVTLVSYAVVDEVDRFTDFLQRVLAPGNDENEQFQILEIRPSRANGRPGVLPSRLNAIPVVDEGAVVRTRRFTLQFTGRTINGKSMDHMRIDEIVNMGDVERWDIVNESIAYHPFHIHGVQFRVLDRNGRPAPAHEQGWKDTVLIGPSETVRLVMQFTAYADPKQPYMFHCHILEHEDLGMMGQFVVVDATHRPGR